MPRRRAEPLPDIRAEVERRAITLGAPARCETNETDPLGDCIVCSAVNGQACLRERALLFPPEPLNEDGWTDWIKPLPGYRLQCCDCGSLHEMEFAVEDGEVVFRARPLDSPVADERARVVAYLETYGEPVLAEAIQRGDHAREAA